MQVPGVHTRVRGRLYIASLQSTIFEHPLAVGPEINRKQRYGKWYIFLMTYYDHISLMTSDLNLSLKIIMNLSKIYPRFSIRLEERRVRNLIFLISLSFIICSSSTSACIFLSLNKCMNLRKYVNQQTLSSNQSNVPKHFSHLHFTLRSCTFITIS